MQRVGVVSGLLLLLVPSPAAAQAVTYRVEIDNWTVFTSGATGCQAFNRDPTEFNVAPYSALNLRQDAGSSEASLYLMFWPGAFVPEQSASLTFDYFGGAASEVMDGKVEQDFIVRLDRTFDSKALQALADQRLVTITSDDGPAPIAFKTDALTEVAYHLESCVAAITAR